MNLKITYQRPVILHLSINLEALAERGQLSNLDMLWDEQLYEQLQDILRLFCQQILANHTQILNSTLSHTCKLLIAPPIFSVDRLTQALKDADFPEFTLSAELA